ncbi:MAG: YkgJ family cysteine cluster protein [Blastocatellia bacterium]
MKNVLETVHEEYSAYAAEVDREFQRSYARYGSRMQCRRGCSMCCSQMFSISLIEAAYISKGVKRLPKSERDRLQTAARDYIARARRMTDSPSRDSDETEEALTPRPGLRLACPALAGDACSIYGLRPLICRKWGIPIFNPKKPMELQACELNFKPGEELDVEGVVEPQAALLENWVGLKERAKARLGFAPGTATVAEAILYDYETVIAGGDRIELRADTEAEC